MAAGTLTCHIVWRPLGCVGAWGGGRRSMLDGLPDELMSALEARYKSAYLPAAVQLVSALVPTSTSAAASDTDGEAGAWFACEPRAQRHCVTGVSRGSAR